MTWQNEEQTALEGNFHGVQEVMPLPMAGTVKSTWLTIAMTMIGPFSISSSRRVVGDYLLELAYDVRYKLGVLQTER